MLLARVSQKKSDSRYTVVCASTMLLKATATFPFLCIRLLHCNFEGKCRNMPILWKGRQQSIREGVIMDRLHLFLDKWELSY